MTMLKKLGCTKRTWVLAREQRLCTFASKSKVTKSELRIGYESLELLQGERHSSLLKIIALLIIISVCTIVGIITSYEFQKYFIVLDAFLLIYFGWYFNYYLFLEERLQFWYMIAEIMESKYKGD